MLQKLDVYRYAGDMQPSIVGWYWVTMSNPYLSSHSPVIVELHRIMLEVPCNYYRITQVI